MALYLNNASISRAPQRTARTSCGTGAYFTYSNVPSWADRITLNIENLSNNAGYNYQLQIGDSGGIETSGYYGCGWYDNGGFGGSRDSTGWRLPMGWSGHSLNGSIVLTRQDHGSGPTWTVFAVLGDQGSNLQSGIGGWKSLNTDLTSIRFGMDGGSIDGGTYSFVFEELGA